jgi:orotidine-5'-phosphate decarboxylase
MPAASLTLDDEAREAVPADPRLIVALDLPSRADAESMVERLGDAVSFYKIGLQLLASGGMAMAKDLKTRGRQVFADWKLHDIGATVEKATAAIVATGSCDFLTVHAEPQVMAAAVRGRAGAVGTKILGVTVLTSLSEADVKEIGYAQGIEALVERRIRQALDAGVDGVVVSPRETAMARASARPGPGRTIRPAPPRPPRPWPPARATWSAAGRSPPPMTRARRPRPSPRRCAGLSGYFLQPQPWLPPPQLPPPPHPLPG